MAIAAPVGPATLAARAAPAEIWGAPDWTTLGLVLAIVGSFLLANGILFRHPRALVEERFGRRRMPLRTIRAFIFHRVQMSLGFGFLVTGFALQLWGHLRPPAVGAESASPALWIGLVVVLAIALEAGGWWWSLLSFRRHVTAYLREDPPDLESDPVLARELGELFAVPSHRDDTVQTFAVRLRKAVGLPDSGRNLAGARTAAEQVEVDVGVED
ncbi:MAG TPA: hypothetical protein VMS76_14555 [Planctomycetota bacterium]|nr:hypothetical protein [Planctomycetota bacterium]